ncbi:hypothetical protein MMC19_004219 [Ptychographa xylographoides]|nr:hypothetical protein [Ptychographa xylographoides]
MPSAILPPAPSSNLPPADTFDFIPPLHALLSRLLVNQSDPSRPTLSPKDLAAEAVAIKIKIQRARAALDALPDMDRTVEEQEEEIHELRERIGAQKAVLRDVAKAGREED